MRPRSSRHCMVVHAYYPLAETRVQRQAEALVEEGFQVDVICLRWPGELSQEQVNGVKIHRLPVRRHKGWGIMAQLVEYLAFFGLVFFQLTFMHLKNRYQVVQVHNLPDFLVFVALIPHLMGAKVILDLHDLMPEFFASRSHQGMDNFWVRLMCRQEQLACSFSDHVITVTDDWRRNLTRRGLSPGKCSVVMNVADDRLFTRAVKSLQDRIRPGFCLLYHGILVYRNGIDILLKALARVEGELPHLRLTIHGHGEYLAALQSLCRELKLEARVHFDTTFMPIEALPAFISGFDAGVVPYRNDIFTDSVLPTKLMECAALGMPVIAARTAAISSYFDETMVAFFEPGDTEGLARCLRTLYHQPSYRETLARNIQKFNQLHNWARQKIEYIGLVRNLAGPCATKKRVGA